MFSLIALWNVMFRKSQSEYPFLILYIIVIILNWLVLNFTNHYRPEFNYLRICIPDLVG